MWSKAKVPLLLLLVLAPLILLVVGCNSGTSSTPGQDVSLDSVQINRTRANNRGSESPSGVATEEGSKLLKTVKFTVPTIT